MISILFFLVLGGNTYGVVDKCDTIGSVYFPPNDLKEIRLLSICDETATKQVIEHELVHICMHDHQHRFDTKVEVERHIAIANYSEEQIAQTLAPCEVENREKLYKGLRNHNVHIQ